MWKVIDTVAYCSHGIDWLECSTLFRPITVQRKFHLPQPIFPLLYSLEICFESLVFLLVRLQPAFDGLAAKWRARSIRPKFSKIPVQNRKIFSKILFNLSRLSFFPEIRKFRKFSVPFDHSCPGLVSPSLEIEIQYD